MKFLNPTELRNFHRLPSLHLETREEPDPVAAATRAIEEMRTGAATFQQQTDERLTRELRALTERIDAIDVRAQRPGATQQQQTPERRAFETFVRSGERTLEQRTLNASEAAGGGVLAPGDFETEIIRNAVLFSPIRSVARVSSLSAGSLMLPVRTGQLEGGWIGETREAAESEPTYGGLNVTPQEMATAIPVSQTLLDDAAFDMFAELSRDIGERFAQIEGAAFISGDGTQDKPLGILNTTGIPEWETGAANGFPSSDPADVLIDMMHEIPSVYANRATWLMNRRTMGVVRKMKDSDGRYLWQPPLTDGNPPTILGRPVLETPDLANVEAGTYPIIFGDFQAGFRIFDRKGTTILRDPYTLAKKRVVLIHASKRVTGVVTLPEAMIKLKVAA